MFRLRTPVDLAKRMERCSQVGSQGYRKAPRFTAKRHVPAPQPLRGSHPPSCDCPVTSRLPSPADPPLAARGGPSQRGFHEGFPTPLRTTRPPRHLLSVEAEPGQGGTLHGYSLRGLLCCLLLYRGEQNGAEEVNLRLMKPIPERTSTVVLAGQVIFYILCVLLSRVQRVKSSIEGSQVQEEQFTTASRAASPIHFKPAAARRRLQKRAGPTHN